MGTEARINKKTTSESTTYTDNLSQLKNRKKSDSDVVLKKQQQQQEQQQQQKQQQQQQQTLQSKSSEPVNMPRSPSEALIKETPSTRAQKLALQIFLLGVLALPLFYLYENKSIPILFQTCWIVCLGYIVVFAVLKKVSSTRELVLKRAMSGVGSIILGGSACYALYFDPEMQGESLASHKVTFASSIALGWSLGFYNGDLLTITPQQMAIPSLIFHHVAVVIFWNYVGIRQVSTAVCLLGQLQEICNPNWYLYWILFSSYTYKDKRRWVQFLFFGNALIIWLGYVFIRFIWAQLRVSMLLPTLFFEWPLDTTLFLFSGLSVETVINCMNIYKLSRSICNAWIGRNK